MSLVDFLVNYIVPFLILLTVVVFVHEMGHYWVARKNGVKVEVFSVGFGREIVGFNDKNGTRWKLGLIPFGGYVKMFGDEDAASTPDTSREFTEAEKALSFHHKKLHQRAAIVAAGPLSNLLFAILVFAVLFMTVGQYSTPAVVGAVQPGSAAEAAGLKPHDRIASINGSSIQRFEEIQQIVRLGDGSTLALQIDRDGSLLDVSITPVMTEMTDRFGNVQRTPLLGISASTAESHVVVLSPPAAIAESFHQTWVVTSSTLSAVGQMISGKRDSSDLGGPLRIAKFSGEAAQGGAANFITFIAVLSINLALINLFPIPMLDGGHLLFYAIEGIIRRPLSERSQEYGFRIGLILVLALFVFATWNDLIHLKVFDFLKG
ncbi:MAG: RIP metalloprotease RseP [Alphaproteobacteria bacterium]|nr:RIP metalloprotease RseP [Alphaproteobacteria bacterium]